MERKQAIAIGIALQSQVLKTCPLHQQVYFDDEMNPAGAFALAIEMVRAHQPQVEEFQDNAHELTDLLSDTLGMAPLSCPQCVPQFVEAVAAAPQREVCEVALRSV